MHKITIKRTLIYCFFFGVSQLLCFLCINLIFLILHILVQSIPLIVFFGTLFLLLVVLLIVYCCVRNGTCCWHQKSRRGSKVSRELENVIDLVGEPDSGDDSYSKYPMIKRTSYHPLKNEAFQDGEPTDFFVQQPEYLNSGPRNTFMNKRQSVQSFVTGYTSLSHEDIPYSTEDTDDDGGRKIRKKKVARKNEHAEFIEGSRVHLSFLYSKADLFLMVTVNEVEGVTDKLAGGYDLVRVAITLFPKKKYRSKTKFIFVKDSKASFDEPFKFSNVTRESLFSSAFRIRLQGKQKMGRECCLGEVMVHLADVAQRAGGFMTWRTFGKEKK